MDWDQGSSSVLFKSVYARSFFGYQRGCLEYWAGSNLLYPEHETKKNTLFLVSTGIFEMYPILDPRPSSTRLLTERLQQPLYLRHARANQHK